MAGDKSAKETKKAAGGDAPKAKAKRKDVVKEEAERPKKVPKTEKAEKAAPAPKAKAEPAAKGKSKTAVEEGGKSKKEKKVKDPNAPKKNLTAFMYFSNAQRDKVKTDHPGVTFGEVGKLLGERWKALSADDKTEYEDQAKKDKERYAKELEAYKGGEGAAAAPTKSRARAKPKPKPAKEEEEPASEAGGSDAEHDSADEDND